MSSSLPMETLFVRVFARLLLRRWLPAPFRLVNKLTPASRTLTPLNRRIIYWLQLMRTSRTSQTLRGTAGVLGSPVAQLTCLIIGLTLYQINFNQTANVQQLFQSRWFSSSSFPSHMPQITSAPCSWLLCLLHTIFLPVLIHVAYGPIQPIFKIKSGYLWFFSANSLINQVVGFLRAGGGQVSYMLRIKSILKSLPIVCDILHQMCSIDVSWPQMQGVIWSVFYVFFSTMQILKV